MRDHLCYLRSIPGKKEFIPKFIFDFECSQDKKEECTEGTSLSGISIVWNVNPVGCVLPVLNVNGVNVLVRKSHP